MLWYRVGFGWLLVFFNIRESVSFRLKHEQNKVNLTQPGKISQSSSMHGITRAPSIFNAFILTL